MENLGPWGGGVSQKEGGELVLGVTILQPPGTHKRVLVLPSWWNRGSLPPSGKASPPPGLGIASPPQELGSSGGSLPPGVNPLTDQNSLASPTLITCHWPPPQATGLLKTIYTWFCISSPLIPSPGSWNHCHENCKALLSPVPRATEVEPRIRAPLRLTELLCNWCHDNHSDHH